MDVEMFVFGMLQHGEIYFKMKPAIATNSRSLIRWNYTKLNGGG